MTLAVELAALGLLVALVVTVCRYYDLKAWNGGVCPKCQRPWVRFDTDSSGGRMYRCQGKVVTEERCRNFIAISWRVRDEHTKRTR